MVYEACQEHYKTETILRLKATVELQNETRKSAILENNEIEPNEHNLNTERKAEQQMPARL